MALCETESYGRFGELYESRLVAVSSEGLQSWSHFNVLV